VDGFFADIVGTTDFALHGDFNEHGLITGATKFAQYTNDTFDGMAIKSPNGILTGIIGQGGAVGVFHSTATGAGSYVGGFVVHPDVVDIADVNYSDWIRGKSYHTDPPSTGGTQFLKTTDGVISRGTTDAELSDITYLTLNNATLGLTKTIGKAHTLGSPIKNFTDRNGVGITNFAVLKNTFEGVPIGGDANDGIAYYEAEGNTYAGILDTTHLGKPLTQTTGKLNWHGQFHLTANINKTAGYVVKYTRDFVLTINFNSTGGTLDGFIQELDDLKINNPNQVRLEDYLAYERDFILSNATFDTNGVITGETVFKSSNIGGLNFGRIIELPGTLTGLIGQEGVVAVFSNTDESAPSFGYAGGFVVQPNVRGAVTYADWVRANAAPLTKTDRVGENDVISPLVESGIHGAASHLPGVFDVPLEGNHFLTTTDGVISRGSKDPGHAFVAENSIVNLPDDRVARKPTYVRFGDATNSEGDKIGDDDFGGFIYYTGWYSTRAPGGTITSRGDVFSYVGILDDTNLGAPLTDTTGTVQWKGQFSYQNYGNLFYNHDNPFTLNITYTATGGKIDAFVPNIGLVDADLSLAMHEFGYDLTGKRNTGFYLEGTFDLRGVISGYTIEKNWYTDATVAATDLRAVLNAVVASPANPNTRNLDINSYTDRTFIPDPLGVLTGLIGEKG
ncbi:MAG: hypothetical protein K8953_12010, partial [Proteobacteria bacterium]|nr:hypothetical protein [Pseudomonadota bacterium]